MSLKDRIFGKKPASDGPDVELSPKRYRTLRKGGLNRGFGNWWEVGWQKYYGRSEETTLQDLKDPIRRAVHTVNFLFGIYGIPRTDFWKMENDRLARNAIYAICEKAVMDYFSTIKWKIIDKDRNPVDKAEKFLKAPNPQNSFNDMLKMSVRDTIRYDASVWVKTFNLAGELAELWVYSGPEFWIELDKEFEEIEALLGQYFFGPISHGLVKRYWQHSRPGIYIPFAPKEIVYIKMYSRSDSPYGQDFLYNLKWQLEYLIDSTRAAGMTFANGVLPGMKWKHPDMSGPEQLEQRELEKENLTGPDNFGGVLHLFGEEDIEPLTPTLVDMQWLEGQKYISELIWAMFGFSTSEFTAGDINRATAYIQRNITKSRMLAPLCRHYEAEINTKILPYIPGYQEGWEFQFVESVDLDDELKKVQVAQGKAGVAMNYINMGIGVMGALKLAEVGDDLATAVEEELSQLQGEAAPGQMGQGQQMSFPQAISQTKFAGYGTGGAHVEQYQGTAGESEFEDQEEDRETLTKAGERIFQRRKGVRYVDNPSEAPRGVPLYTGPRGGTFFYEEDARTIARHEEPEPRGQITPGMPPSPEELEREALSRFRPYPPGGEGAIPPRAGIGRAGAARGERSDYNTWSKTAYLEPPPDLHPKYIDHFKDLRREFIDKDLLPNMSEGEDRHKDPEAIYQAIKKLRQHAQNYIEWGKSTQSSNAFEYAGFLKKWVEGLERTWDNLYGPRKPEVNPFVHPEVTVRHPSHPSPLAGPPTMEPRMEPTEEPVGYNPFGGGFDAIKTNLLKYLTPEEAEPIIKRLEETRKLLENPPELKENPLIDADIYQREDIMYLHPKIKTGCSGCDTGGKSWEDIRLAITKEKQKKDYWDETDTPKTLADVIHNTIRYWQRKHGGDQEDSWASFNGVEEGIIIDGSGVIREMNMGDTGSIGMEWSRCRGGIVIHNHPSGGAFSVKDVKVIADYGGRAVLCGGKDLVFGMFHPEGKDSLNQLTDNIENKLIGSMRMKDLFWRELNVSSDEDKAHIANMASMVQSVEISEYTGNRFYWVDKEGNYGTGLHPRYKEAWKKVRMFVPAKIQKRIDESLGVEPSKVKVEKKKQPEKKTQTNAELLAKEGFNIAVVGNPSKSGGD